ncbi:Splicing factor 3B subunit 6-like protein [Blattella germanica]|nr:Splicing factor 3B subunit 6-like protein [Blattella germanica]
MYDSFVKYGVIRRIRVRNTPETKGTAFIVYEHIFDAKNVCDHLTGFNDCNRYLVVLYYQSNKAFKRIDIDKKKYEIDEIKTKYGINTDEKEMKLQYIASCRDPDLILPVHWLNYGSHK